MSTKAYLHQRNAEGAGTMDQVETKFLERVTRDQRRSTLKEKG